jgi:hypothetical protein
MKQQIKLLLVALTLSLLMVGCAVNPAQQLMTKINEHVAINRPKAELGVIKWSDYYSEMLELVRALPNNVSQKNLEMTQYSYGIEMAKKYESGEISKEEFYKWRADSNNLSSEYSKKFNQAKAECEFESVSRANPNSSVEYAGNNINRKLSSAITGGYEVAMRQVEIFQLCMKAKGF